jgi:hypothetical protein
VTLPPELPEQRARGSGLSRRARRRTTRQYSARDRGVAYRARRAQRNVPGVRMRCLHDAAHFSAALGRRSGEVPVVCGARFHAWGLLRSVIPCMGIVAQRDCVRSVAHRDSTRRRGAYRGGQLLLPRPAEARRTALRVVIAVRRTVPLHPQHQSLFEGPAERSRRRPPRLRGPRRAWLAKARRSAPPHSKLRRDDACSLGRSNTVCPATRVHAEARSIAEARRTARGGTLPQPRPMKRERAAGPRVRRRAASSVVSRVRVPRVQSAAPTEGVRSIPRQ